MNIKVFLVLACLAVGSNCYRQLGSFKVPNAAFLQLLQVNPSTGPDLFITSFQGFGYGAIYNVPDIGSKLGNISAIKPSTAAGSLNWPNNIYLAPSTIFTQTTVVWADGFLVPGKTDGNLYAMHYVNGNFTKPFALTKTKSGYFYHQVTFRDMNNDGLLDIVTARVTKPTIGRVKSDFIWLECPQDPAARDVIWKENLLMSDGPDVDFHMGELDNDPSTLDVVAPVFFAESLNVYQFDPSTLKLKSQAVIDKSIGPPYCVQVDDFNLNGKFQILVSNHAATQATSGLFLYDIPAKLTTDKWTRHQIGSNFPISAAGMNQAAPGFSYSTVQKLNNGEFPSVLVAGDGAERAYLFTRTGDYQYTQEEVLKTNGVVGALAIGDVNGDGWNDFFVPNYDRGIVFVYTFAP